jgi:hypothetical protein
MKVFFFRKLNHPVFNSGMILPTLFF